MMLQSRLSDGTMPQLSVTTAPLLLPLGVAGTTPSSISEPAQPDVFTLDGRVNMQRQHSDICGIGNAADNDRIYWKAQ